MSGVNLASQTPYTPHCSLAATLGCQVTTVLSVKPWRQQLKISQVCSVLALGQGTTWGTGWAQPKCAQPLLPLSPQPLGQELSLQQAPSWISQGVKTRAEGPPGPLPLCLCHKRGPETKACCPYHCISAVLGALCVYNLHSTPALGGCRWKPEAMERVPHRTLGGEVQAAGWGRVVLSYSGFTMAGAVW